MTRQLLFSAIAMVGATAYAAGEIQTIAPDLAITHLSPNGRYAVSQVLGYVEIFDLETGTKNDYYGDEEGGIEYTFGMGNAMSDIGIGVGSTTVKGNACVWQNGEWSALPVISADMTNLSQGITPDGRRICGQVGNALMTTENDEIISIPCIWERQEDGMYSGPVLLPHPDKDLTGRTPQYVTAIAISDDGRTIAGQVRDYSGVMVQPILYREDEKGEWSYEMLFPEMANPDGIVLPEFPGEAPQNAPDMRDYLSREELAAYDAAVAKWESEGSGDWSTYPDMEDYMTQAEKLAFNMAVDAYNKEIEEWDKKYEPFSEALSRLIESATVYLFNNVYISPDGKMYGSTTIDSVEDESSWSGFSELYRPVLMDVENNIFKKLDYDKSLIVTGVTEDYTVLANSDGLRTPKQAYLALKGESDWVPLNTWVDGIDPEIGKWFTENTSHDIETINAEGVLEILEGYICSGIAVCTPDMTLFATYSEILWESETAYFTESFIFSLNSGNGIRTVGEPVGEVKSVRYYGPDGSLLPDRPESGISIRVSVYETGAVRSEKLLR